MAVRQITTRLAIDGEQEYKKQLAAVNRELGNLGAEMKLVDAQFKGQANSSEALRAKHDLLKQSIEQQVGKVESLKEALEEAKQAYTENDARTDSYRRQLLSAETALAKLNSELVENEKYLDEAEQSADGCAKSIDGYGKEVKKAADETNGATDGLSEFSDTLAGLKDSVAAGDIGGIVSSLGAMKGLLVGGAIVSGLKEVAEKIWDVAKAGAAYADDMRLPSGRKTSFMRAFSSSGRRSSRSRTPADAESRSTVFASCSRCTTRALSGWNIFAHRRKSGTRRSSGRSYTPVLPEPMSTALTSSSAAT